MSAIETDLLKPELVFFDFEATDRIDFFTKLGEKLKEGGYVKDSWLDAILEREKNYPTGLECTSISVALPHVDPQHLNKPYIAIIKPKNPIEFDGMADTGLVNAQQPRPAGSRGGPGRRSPGLSGHLHRRCRLCGHHGPDHAPGHD